MYRRKDHFLFLQIVRMQRKKTHTIITNIGVIKIIRNLYEKYPNSLSVTKKKGNLSPSLLLLVASGNSIYNETKIL